MKILFKIVQLFPLVFFLACSEESKHVFENEKEFNCKALYPNGTLKSLGDTVNGKYEGLYKEFYSDGNIRYINYYKNGLLTGPAKEFFENGNPKVDMYYVNDRPLGVQYVFFESDSARVKNKFIVTRYKGKEMLSSRIEFKLNGDTLYDEGKVSVLLLNDTFKVGDKIAMKFILRRPEFTNYRVHIGRFNRQLELEDSVNYKTYEGVGHETAIEYLASRKGINIVRGYMEDFKIEKQNVDGSYSTIGTLNNWFDVEFHVE